MCKKAGSGMVCECRLRVRGSSYTLLCVGFMLRRITGRRETHRRYFR